METENRTIIFDTSNGKPFSADDDLYSARSKVVNAFATEVEATILINAYNQLDKVRNCVNSVLRNTRDVKYKLLLIDNGSDDENILPFFESVEHTNKHVLRITNNMQLALPMTKAGAFFEGKYVIFLNGDMVVTPRWLSNLIRCAESDPKIGIVVPISSNVSNLQGYDFDFRDLEDMYQKSEKINISDPKKWEERLRLISAAPLLKKECIDIVGAVFDPGFLHDFADDEITYRVRRAGYKAILAKDTWVHHDHYHHTAKADSLNIGRQNFKDKYHGIDAWDDINNYCGWFKESIGKPNSHRPDILGIDVRCGTPILEIKNRLRELGVFDTKCFAVTQDARYYTDLQSICGDSNVICGEPLDALLSSEAKEFDYIIIDKDINTYEKPFDIIKAATKLLKKNGTMFAYLKNAYNLYFLLNSLGVNQIYLEDVYTPYTLELFNKKLQDLGLKLTIVLGINGDYKYIDSDTMSALENIVKMASENNFKETWSRLNCERYAIKITK